MHVPAAGLEYSARDDALRTRVFRCDDPESLSNLLMEPPPSETAAPEIEFQYDLTPKSGDRPFIRCAHCARRNHWKGFVVRYAAGTRLLVGKDCGAELYGATFVQIEREFDQLAVRQIRLRRLSNVIEHFPPFLRFLAALSRHETVMRVSHLRAFVEATAEPLYRHLRSAAQRQTGTLILIERVRDYAAEEARRDNSSKPIFVEQTRDAGRLDGWTVFCPDSELVEQRVRDAHDDAKQWFGELTTHPSSDYWTDDRSRKLFSKLEAIANMIEAQLQLIEAYGRAVSPGNLRLIATWATASEAVDGAWSVEGNRLVGVTANLHFPPPAQPPDTADLVAFTRALRMQDQFR